MLQPVDLSTKLDLARGVVCGMAFLHSRQPHPVIHGELKMENVLVGIGPVAKVCVNQTINCHSGSINNHFLWRTKFYVLSHVSVAITYTDYRVLTFVMFGHSNFAKWRRKIFFRWGENLYTLFPLSSVSKKNWKSANTWGGYGQEFSVSFFWLTV